MSSCVSISMASRVMLATSASVTGLMRAIWAVTGRTAGAKNAAAASERNRRKGCPFKNRAFLNNTGRINLAPKKQERAKKKNSNVSHFFWRLDVNWLTSPDEYLTDND